MTITHPYDQPGRRHLAGWPPFMRHYIEMVLAMVLALMLWRRALARAVADDSPAGRSCPSTDYGAVLLETLGSG